MKHSSQTVLKLELPTANRGIKQFIVSKNDKGYYAHELGKKTEIAQVLGTDTLYAHRLNDSTRYGNQYTRSWKVKPLPSIHAAIAKIYAAAKQIIYRF